MQWAISITYRIASSSRGIQLATRFGLLPLEVETDSTELINAMNNGHTILSNLIQSCRSIMRQEKSLLLQHNFRQGNSVADALAKEAKYKENKQYKPGCIKLFADPPFFVKHYQAKDQSQECSYIKAVPLSVCNMLRAIGNKNVPVSSSILYSGVPASITTSTNIMACNMSFI